MTYLVMSLIVSGLLNILLIWYVIKVLSKLLYTSDNMGDLYIIFRMYEKFVTSLYEMEMFYGEPILQELIYKTRLLREEMERFESIYNLTTNVELMEEEMLIEAGEEMLNDNTQEETQEAY